MCRHRQGDIATCAGTYLHVWSINGDEIASINTATARSQQIQCVAMSTMMEWDAHNVIITGSSDGVVRVSASAVAMCLLFLLWTFWSVCRFQSRWCVT